MRVLAVIFFLALLCTRCNPFEDQPDKDPSSKSDPATPISELKRYDSAPIVHITTYHAFPGEKEGEQKAIGEELARELGSIFELVVTKDLRGLESKVHPEDGLWVDLKAHRSYKQVQQELQNPRSYLNVFFLDTTALRQKTGDPDKLSVRDVLLVTRSIDAEIYYEGNGEYELRLKLVDAPNYSFYLNNPVFRKKDGRWFVYRMF